MRRRPRDAKDGIFAGGMGADTIFQGVVIALLTLAAYFIGISTAGVSLADAIASDQVGLVGMTMAFLTLSMVEMFHALNMRSQRGSIFTLKGQNKWLWASLGVALLLTFLVIETPLAQAFDFAELDVAHYLISMGLAILIIPIVEAEKAVMRAIDKGKK